MNSNFVKLLNLKFLKLNCNINFAARTSIRNKFMKSHFIYRLSKLSYKGKFNNFGRRN